MAADVIIKDKNGANSLTLNAQRITNTLDKNAAQFGVSSTSGIGPITAGIVDLGVKTERWQIEGYVTDRATINTYITRMKTTYFVQKYPQIQIGTGTLATGGPSPTNGAFEQCMVESFSVDVIAAEGDTSETDFLYRWRLTVVTNVTGKGENGQQIQIKP